MTISPSQALVLSSATTRDTFSLCQDLSPWRGHSRKALSGPLVPLFSPTRSLLGRRGTGGLRLSGKDVSACESGAPARWSCPYPVGQYFEPGPLLCRNRLAHLGVATGWPGCGLCSSPTAWRSPREVRRVTAAQLQPGCPSCEFAHSLSSARSLPREAWASWGVFMEQNGEEGRGGFYSHRFQAWLL